MSMKNIIGTILYGKSAKDFLGAPVKIEGRWVSAIRTAFFADPLHTDDTANVFVAFSDEAVLDHKKWLEETIPPREIWNHKKQRMERHPQYVIPEAAHQNLAQVLLDRIRRIVPAEMKFLKNGQHGSVKITLRSAAHIDVVKNCVRAEEDPSSPRAVFRGGKIIVGDRKNETGFSQCRPNRPMDYSPHYVVKTRGDKTQLDFSIRGKIRGFRDPDAKISGRYYVTDDGTAHVFFQHLGFSEEINGKIVRFPADEHYKYFSIRYDDTVTDVMEMVNRAGMPIRDTQELDRVIPDFLNLSQLQKLRRMKEEVARDRGWTAIEEARARGGKIAAARLREDRTKITATFGRENLNADQKEQQRRSDLTAIRWRMEDTGKSAQEVLESVPGFGEFLTKADRSSLTAPISGNKVQSRSSVHPSQREIRAEMAKFPNRGVMSPPKTKAPLPQGFQSDPWKMLEESEFPDGKPSVRTIAEISKEENQAIREREAARRMIITVGEDGEKKEVQMPLFTSTESETPKLSATVLKQLAISEDKFQSKEKEGQ